ncbi:PucR family transcriptional regulator [Pseudonocardia sp. H11422]|uniref:PucR family transcriptional regulator n=1 Tax=Pseudonocardia sp. H11422 TaxID=2835866 RepID=UPI001BDDAC24|nr:helix-turn-helix domain-containing protein [Pseudonocardia sp. H11422]
MTALTFGQRFTPATGPDARAGDAFSDRAAPTAGALTLQNLLTAIGSGYLETICAPCGLEPMVCGVLIWDVAGPVSIDPGDLVLAVGVAATSSAFPELVDLAGRAGAAAVAVKGPLNDAWISSLAQGAGITVFAVPRELAWDQVHAVVRRAIATASATAEDSDAAPSRDLFALAAAAAADLGGPVQIHDAGMHLLAASPGDEFGDPWRTSEVAGHPPSELLGWLRRTGLLERVRGASRPIRVGPPGSPSRLVTAVRAGTEVLGFVSVSEGAVPLGLEHEATLLEIARMATTSVIRLRVAEDAERRLRSDLLRSVIDGTGSAFVLASRLGIHADEEFRLIGFQPHGGVCGQPIEQIQVHGLVELGMEGAAHGGLVATSGSRTYALLPSAQQAVHEVKELAGEILGQATHQLGVAMVAAIGTASSGLARLPTARAEVDRVLQLLSAGNGPPLATFDELRSRAVLAELRELAAERPHLLHGHIAMLREIDRTQNTQYISTLRAYFDSACDPVEASKRLYVHRNTLRYRLRRMKERCGLDLLDPNERLIAELQLRLTVET